MTMLFVSRWNFRLFNSLLTASFKRPVQNPSSSCRGGEGEGEGEGRYIASSVTSLKETTVAADDVTLSFKLG